MESELIKVTYEGEKALVSARELHEFLEIGTEFRKWFPRMCEYGFEENNDYLKVSQKCPTSTTGQIQVDYAISLDMAKELSMIQRTNKGKEARQYFINCEKKLREVVNKPMLPKDYIEALERLLESEKEKALMSPKVEYYHSVLNPGEKIKLLTPTAIAKDLGMSAIKFNKILLEEKIAYKQNKTWYLYSEYQDKVPEYADYKITEWGQDLRFTEKGREWIIELFKSKKITE